MTVVGITNALGTLYNRQVTSPEDIVRRLVVENFESHTNDPTSDDRYNTAFLAALKRWVRGKGIPG